MFCKYQLFEKNELNAKSPVILCNISTDSDDTQETHINVMGHLREGKYALISYSQWNLASFWPVSLLLFYM